MQYFMRSSFDMTATDYRCSRSRQVIDGIFVAGLLLMGPALAASQTVHRLASADTFVRVEAGAHAPRLLGLGRAGAQPWENQAEDALPDHVTTDSGTVLPLAWHPNALLSHFDRRRVSLVYDSITPRLRLRWQWRARSAHGPLEHDIRIDNQGTENLWLPLQPSLRFDWHIESAPSLARFWVEKGAGTPSAEGVHRALMRDGDNWVGTSSTYAHPREGEPREMIPFMLVERADGDRVGWYLGIEFSGRTHITLERTAHSLRGEAGLNPDPGPYRTRLAAGASFETPTVFLGAFRGAIDDAGNILRPWVRAVLNNPATVRDTHYPLLVNNSWAVASRWTKRRRGA